MLNRLEELDEARRLWGQLGDIPVDDDGNIQVPFMTWPVGTNREDIWHWFEDTFDISITVLSPVWAQEEVHNERNKSF